MGDGFHIVTDLHMHSTASDGRMSPHDVMTEAANAGLQMVALTDHDTLAGLEEARSAAQVHGLTFVNGVEISARENDEEVHLLAYRFNPENAGLLSLLSLQQQRRTERAEEFVRCFRRDGLISDEQQLPEPAPGRSLARPHVAALLVESGAVSSMEEAFSKYLIPGTPHFVEKALPSGAEVMDVVHSASGLVFLAHPGHHTAHQTVRNLIRASIDGVEVVHPSHDIMLEEYYRSLARQNGLLMSGGSDFHARNSHGGSSLGQIRFEPDAALLQALRTH